ncbi:unnamed protein product [Rotaria sp. Silwood2]|nr:unnamed protein product [Rotaria sp. Silwood2]CAF4037128.1 unnamed protein product [Rotaria sp. Silwood2]
MLSGERKSPQSQTESVLSGSIRSGPVNEINAPLSHHSSVSEDDHHDHFVLAQPKQQIPAIPIPSAFTHMSNSRSTSKSSTPDAVISISTKNTTNVPKKTNITSVKQPTVHRITRDEKKKVSQITHNQIKTQSKSKHSTPGLAYVRVSARDIENEEPRSTSAIHVRGGRKHRSIFEKVDLHSGRTTYLGCGSFSQLEDCISDCLKRDRRHKNVEVYATKRDDPLRCLTRASILDDYCYDGIILPKCHKIRSRSCDRYDCDCCVIRSNSCDRVCCDYRAVRSSACDPYDCDYYRKCAGELSLPEIREVNDALDKCGIPIFSHHRHYPDHHQRPVRDVVSACELLLSDPTFAAYRHGSPAVSHAWDAMRHYQPHPDAPGYGSSAVRAVSSRLFHPDQQPYSPVQNVSSQIFHPPPPQPPPYNPAPGGPPNIFNPPQQPPYNPGQFGPPNTFNPPQQPPGGSGPSVLSRLFGGGGGQQPPPSMPPPSMPPPMPPMPPPQQQAPPSGAGQSVLSRLFGGGGGQPQ